jgi:cytochrome c6
MFFLKNKSIAFRKIFKIAFVTIIFLFVSSNINTLAFSTVQNAIALKDSLHIALRAAPEAIAAENNSTNAAKIFEVNCAGCHPNGGNIIRRGKNLKQKALQKNKLDSIDSIADLVTHGKNNMSAFGDRLSQDEIERVSAYVLEEAKKGWH